MAKDLTVKIKLEINGEKERVEARGMILLVNQDNRTGCICGGMIQPEKIAAALIHHALSRQDGSNLVRDLVTQIMIRGCQEQELVDSASFVLETARMIKEVLGQEGENGD